MADEFDPLKQAANQPTESLYATVQKHTVHNEDDLLRPEHENVLKSQPKQTNTSKERPQQQEMYHRLNYVNTAPKAPVRSTNPFAEELTNTKSEQTSASLAPTISKSTSQTPAPLATATSLPTASASAQRRTAPIQERPESYYQELDHQTGPPPAYQSTQHYDYGHYHKKKGVSAAIDRLVDYFPVLGLFYKKTPPDLAENYAPEYEQEYYPEGQEQEAPQLVDENQVARDLTSDELSLKERYANKLRTQIIYLQVKDQTQPVDVCLHHDTYTVYACDVGRSVIEIFDMYGKLQHVIDDQATIKFQPTAIAVAHDGTIIVSSHFNHRLHMYSPSDAQEYDPANHHEGYRFEQYKLGSPGHDIHQFHHPADIAIDYQDGYLYVCDRGNSRLQVLRPEGVCERIIQLFSQEQGQTPVAPLQIAHQQHGDQLVCIVDAGDALCFIPKCSDGAIFVEPFYVVDNSGVGLQGASGIALDANDRIFISDTGHHRIVICTPEGYYITHFSSEGNGPGELRRPCGIDITRDGTIIVADSGNKRLQLFGSVRERAEAENKSAKEKADNNKDLMGDPQNVVRDHI